MNASVVSSPAIEEAWEQGSVSSQRFEQRLVVSKNHLGSLAYSLKRGMDLAGGAFLLILLAPLMLLVTAFIFLTFSGPVVYRHTRIGFNGKSFVCYKFRTMVVGAQEYLDWYLENNSLAKSEWEQSLKLKSDPRVTRWGHFLRVWSLDELPQLWNVIRGDMSLVGPRPMMREELEIYGTARYCLVKPGITGPWQVSGRNNLTFKERARLDSWYVDNWNFILDLKLILLTIPTVLGRKGAF